MRSVTAGVLALLIALWLSAPATAGGQVLGLTGGVEELELYKTPDAEEPSLTLGPGSLHFPSPVLETSDNGMLKIEHDGAAYWVISDDVKTDMTRKVDTGGCGPKVASTLVTHGKRGAGEGCQ